MNSIIINDTNRDRITAAIREVEGKAYTRTVEYADLVRATQRIEKKLGVPKVHLEGVKYDVDIHAQNFPKKYKYKAESTQFVVEFSKGKWRLVSIERAYTRTEGHDFKCITMPGETMTAIVKTMMDFC
jgi:hypothetical protein